MTATPTGTVVFLFTDVEGSTRLWEQDPAGMRGALARHDAIVRASIERFGGYVFSTAGDAFAAAFSTAGSAIDAALDAQNMLMSVAWETPRPLRVRMGVHTGVAQERDGNYFGAALNRGARIMAAAHGGQILCSASVAALASQRTLVSLGEHRLKDLQAPETLWQVGTASFPAVRTIDRARHNLPMQQTDLIGRDHEIVEVATLLQSHRLVTLTGVGGTGKTRLALAVAAERLDQFTDGVFFVSLAAINDPSLIASAVAEAVGLTAWGTEPSSLFAFLGNREVLVVLDNCEHLIDEVADLVDAALASGSMGRLLATSREALGVDGEQTFTVPSLGMDSLDSPAERLLLERARALRPDLRVHQAEIASVIEICVRLDGIPLALELAAAQLAHLSPGELAARLDDRFRLLVGGRRRRVQRQQTLQAMMDWSWDLLHEDERELLAQLAVFAGGWTLSAAEGVCTVASGAPVPTVLGSLVAKSLVVVDGFDEVTRYRMLETVHMYGQQKLLATNGAAVARNRHASFFCAEADRVAAADRWLDIRGAVAWCKEADNIQAVLEWFRDEGRLPDAAALITMPALTWRPQAASERQAQWVNEMLASELDDRQRCVVLVAAAELAWGRGDIAEMSGQAHEAAALSRQVGDNALAAAALILEGITLQARDPDGAEMVLREAAERSRGGGHTRLEAAAWAMAAGLESLGRGDVSRARELVDRALPNTTADGFERRIAEASISTLEVIAGNWTEAKKAQTKTRQAFHRLRAPRTWLEVVEDAVVDAEVGDPAGPTLATAVAELRAAGGSMERPDLLIVPLGRACRERDWRQAADIIASIRAAARTGVSFSSPVTTAAYLRYRSLIPQEALARGAVLDLTDLIESALSPQSVGSILSTTPAITT